jgi:hypothetical protein
MYIICATLCNRMMRSVAVLPRVVQHPGTMALLKIVKQNVAMRIPRQTKLNFHLLQYAISFARGNQMNQHVFQRQVFRPELGAINGTCTMFSSQKVRPLRYWGPSHFSLKASPKSHCRTELSAISIISVMDKSKVARATEYSSSKASSDK